MNKNSHVRSFLSVVTRPRAEPAVNDFPVVAWKAAEGKLRLLSLMCIYCRCLKLVASQYAICRTILPCVQLGNGLEPLQTSRPYTNLSISRCVSKAASSAIWDHDAMKEKFKIEMFFLLKCEKLSQVSLFG